MGRYFETKDYRPTLYFAYQPADDAIASQRDWFARHPKEPAAQRLLLNDIVSGQDILGVLLCRKGRNESLWYGSLMSIDEARARLPGSSATTLSVCASVISGLSWVLKNPRQGFCEPDDVPFEEVLPLILPYIAPMTEAWTDWTPGGVPVDAHTWELKNVVIGAK